MRVLLWSFVLSSLLLCAAPACAFETRIGVPFDEGGAMRLAFDPAGNVVAGGYTHRSGDLAVATVVKLGPDGAVLWKTDVDPLGSFIQSLFVDAIAVGGALAPSEGVESGSFYVGRFTASGAP